MNEMMMMPTAVTHQMYAMLRRLSPHQPDGAETDVRDRGAVSLEQVLWFVAAGVSVALIASILWNKIRDEANTPVNSPDPLGG